MTGEDFDISLPAEEPSPDTLRRIEQEIRLDLRPVRPVGAPWRVFVALFVFLAITSTAAAYELGAFALDELSRFQLSTILGALAVSGAVLTYSFVLQTIPGSRHRISPQAVIAGAVMLLLIATSAVFPFEHDPTSWMDYWPCIKIGVTIAILTMTPLLLVLRRRASLRPALIGAAGGLLVGLAGATTVQIHCPNTDARHILIAHLGVALLCALGGLMAGLAAEFRQSA